jgi:hypothetical protein
VRTHYTPIVRVVVFDRTCIGSGGNLSPIWAAGSALYRAVRRFDAVHGVASWREAFERLATHDRIDELQYWGHGKWGRVLVGDDALDADALRDARRTQLEALRARLAPDALIWFRTCETFGARRGIDFAERLADFLGARVAGHTYVIAFHQSGLHVLAPGARADWPAEEGLAEGTADAPRRARWSRPWAPRTITAVTASVPSRWLPR